MFVLIQQIGEEETSAKGGVSDSDGGEGTRMETYYLESFILNSRPMPFTAGSTLGSLNCNYIHTNDLSSLRIVSIT